VSETVAGLSAQQAAKTACAKTLFFTRWLNAMGLFKPRRENISLFQKIKSDVWSAHPAATRGAYRDRHGRRQRDAVDAKAA
jgi:hypothetical protein